MNRWAGFALWCVVGALFALSCAGMLTIGIMVLPVAVVALIVAIRWAGASGVFGVLCGIAALVGYLGWLNRGGPGDVCTSDAHGVACVQDWDPRPFLVIAVVLVIVGVWLTARQRHARQ